MPEKITDLPLKNISTWNWLYIAPYLTQHKLLKAKAMGRLPGKIEYYGLAVFNVKYFKNWIIR